MLKLKSPERDGGAIRSLAMEERQERVEENNSHIFIIQEFNNRKATRGTMALSVLSTELKRSEIYFICGKGKVPLLISPKGCDDHKHG